MWCSLNLTVPVGSWFCPSEACFTAFADSFTAFADSRAAFFDEFGAAAGVGDEEVLMELEIPN